MKRQFKPVSKKIEQQRGPLFDAPRPETVNMVMSHLSDLIGIGALFTIAKLAKTLATPVRGVPSAQTERKNVNPRKQLDPKTAFLPS